MTAVVMIRAQVPLERDGGADFTEGEACCTGDVTSVGRVCSATSGAPCVVHDEMWFDHF